MTNKLFDSIVRSCGADTDDIHSGEAEGNFWAENELFEAVLREADKVTPITNIGNTQNPPPYPDPKDRQNSQKKKQKKQNPEIKKKDEPFQNPIEPNLANKVDIKAKSSQ